MIVAQIVGGLVGGLTGCAIIVAYHFVLERRRNRITARTLAKFDRMSQLYGARPTPEERERAIRNGVCPVCGTVPGMPCDSALHA